MAPNRKSGCAVAEFLMSSSEYTGCPTEMDRYLELILEASSYISESRGSIRKSVLLSAIALCSIWLLCNEERLVRRFLLRGLQIVS